VDASSFVAKLKEHAEFATLSGLGFPERQSVKLPGSVILQGISSMTIQEIDLLKEQIETTVADAYAFDRDSFVYSINAEISNAQDLISDEIKQSRSAVLETVVQLEISVVYWTRESSLSSMELAAQLVGQPLTRDLLMNMRVVTDESWYFQKEDASAEIILGAMPTTDSGASVMSSILMLLNYLLIL